MTAKSTIEAIKVGVRFRLMLPREKDAEIFWKTDGQSGILSASGSGRAYLYDWVFGPEQDNFDVYEQLGQEIIDSAMKGFNSTIFAYGQTGSGKTHTMLGSEQDPGLARQAVDQIFNTIKESQDKMFLLRVSYMEIYNEGVYDLLAEVKLAPKK